MRRQDVKVGPPFWRRRRRRQRRSDRGGRDDGSVAGDRGRAPNPQRAAPRTYMRAQVRKPKVLKDARVERTKKEKGGSPFDVVTKGRCVVRLLGSKLRDGVAGRRQKSGRRCLGWHGMVPQQQRVRQQEVEVVMVQWGRRGQKQQRFGREEWRNRQLCSLPRGTVMVTDYSGWRKRRQYPKTKPRSNNAAYEKNSTAHNQRGLHFFSCFSNKWLATHR